MNSFKNKYWFTLIEIMLWILIFSIILISWFQFFWNMSIWKYKLVESTDIEKEAFYFSEKLFEDIKKWWLIDYEEYFNRKVVWTDSFTWWHFDNRTWFGNFWYSNVSTIWTNLYWSWFYYCSSWNGALNQVWTWGCLDSLNHSSTNPSSPQIYITSMTQKAQRYWQYSLQFIDYNSDYDWDSWDEDWDLMIIWDEDDKYLWDGPFVFTWWTNVHELYLINWSWDKRTFFRWNVISDPYAPAWASCSFSSSWSVSWSGCLWNIEVLRLIGFDWWMDHNAVNIDSTQYDWIIDTWVIEKGFDDDFNLASKLNTLWYTIADSNNQNYWLPLFPEDINVSNFEVFLYPNKDKTLSWKDFSPGLNISPYLRINFTISSWWKKRKWIKWLPKVLDFSTTINLTDIFSN